MDSMLKSANAYLNDLIKNESDSDDDIVQVPNCNTPNDPGVETSSSFKNSYKPQISTNINANVENEIQKQIIISNLREPFGKDENHREAADRSTIEQILYAIDASAAADNIKKISRNGIYDSKNGNPREIIVSFASKEDQKAALFNAYKLNNIPGWQEVSLKAYSAPDTNQLSLIQTNQFDPEKEELKKELAEMKKQMKHMMMELQKQQMELQANASKIASIPSMVNNSKSIPSQPQEPPPRPPPSTNSSINSSSAIPPTSDQQLFHPQPVPPLNNFNGIQQQQSQTSTPFGGNPFLHGPQQPNPAYSFQSRSNSSMNGSFMNLQNENNMQQMPMHYQMPPFQNTPFDKKKKKEPYGTSEDRYANDLQNVNEIFKVMGVSPNIVKIIRLGHFTSQGRPRRVLVELSTEDEQKYILQNKSKLKNDKKWKGVPMQPFRPKKIEIIAEVQIPSELTKKVEPQKLKPKKTKKSKSTVSPNPFINFATKDNESTDKKEINILVIGETGVGKSTWINGIANYMNFDTFDNALAAKKPICLIPMNFNLYVGEKYEKVTVNMKSTVGERDKNEAEASTGQSCTQEPKVYRYITDTVVFNLIDTPGIGDTRGIEYDIENMKMVLKCLSNWEKIHGICILLKPNVPRLTLSLRYCIEELLVNLHKNSIPNISVIFTNSCSTLFKPGDTMTVLKKLFEDIKSSSGNIIQLSGANIFCIDNEAVRLLYAHQKGVEVEKVHIKNCSTSWTRTVEETYRLFEYITKLSPHSSFETKATSQIRGTLDELSAILADKNDGVVQNKKAFEQQNQLLKMLKDNLVEKQKSTTFQAEHVQKVSLNYPITVCCGPNCIETIRIPNCEKQETFYKKICCPQCPLRNVNGGQIGESNLRQCTAFGSNGFCQSCGCSWQSHMQIRYYQRKTIGNFLSSVDHEEINHLNLQITAKSNYILQQKANLHHLQQRYSIIAALTQPFFEFLRHNSIIPFNSALEEYLEFSIEEREKILKPEDGRFKIESLQKLLAIHQQQKCFADCKDKLALRAANSSTQKITLLNYAQKITMLKNNELIGEELDASNIYQKLFETSEFKVIEILTKIELNNNAADKSQENGSLSKKKKQKSAT